MFVKFILLVFGIYISGGSAAAAPSFVKDTERWLVRLLSVEEGCAATSAIKAAGGIIIYIGPNESRALIIVGDDAADQLVVNEGYHGSRITIDGDSWEVFGHLNTTLLDLDGSDEKVETSTIFFPGHAPGLWDALGDGLALTGEVGGVPLEKYSLQGSGQAMEHLEECAALFAPE